MYTITRYILILVLYNCSIATCSVNTNVLIGDREISRFIENLRKRYDPTHIFRFLRLIFLRIDDNPVAISLLSRSLLDLLSLEYNTRRQ